MLLGRAAGVARTIARRMGDVGPNVGQMWPSRPDLRQIWTNMLPRSIALRCSLDSHTDRRTPPRGGLELEFAGNTPPRMYGSWKARNRWCHRRRWRWLPGHGRAWARRDPGELRSRSSADPPPGVDADACALHAARLRPRRALTLKNKRWRPNNDCNGTRAHRTRWLQVGGRAGAGIGRRIGAFCSEKKPREQRSNRRS